MSLFEIKAEIPADTVEAADGVLQELGVEGWSLLEDVIAKRAWVVGVFAAEAEARARWPELRELPDADWKDSYKVHFKASSFGPLHWVPIWERETYRVPAGEKVLWLDPGMAFGTGNHETTRLVAERLVAYAAERGTSGKVIDAGCGSGILALSAALLGHACVTGFDNDPEAIRVSEENAQLNGLTGRVEFFVGDLVSGLAGRQGDLVLANIQADVLVRFTGELLGAVAPGGGLVLSGILASEQEAVRAAYAAAAPDWGVDARVMGEWCDLLLRRPESS